MTPRARLQSLLSPKQALYGSVVQVLLTGKVSVATSQGRRDLEPATAFSVGDLVKIVDNKAYPMPVNEARVYHV